MYVCVCVCVCVFVFVCLCERAVLGLVSDSNAPVKRCINALVFLDEPLDEPTPSSPHFSSAL